MKAAARFAVIGNPIAHSLSPEVHAEFARGCGIDLKYEKLLAPEDGFAEAAGNFFDTGGRGMNVTAPFKGDAAAWVDRLDENATLTQSVNTIDLMGGAETRGHSTDGPGLVADLNTQWELSLAGLGVLVIGAGGATRGVVPSILAGHPKQLVVANRTLARAEALVRKFQGLSEARLEARSFDIDEADFDLVDFDLVINATSGGYQSSSQGIASALRNALCYDLSYDLRQDTAFCAEARRRGAVEVRDGLGMLVWQAAFSFEIWHGVLPDAEGVLLGLRNASVRRTPRRDG